jgi:hypothetical protein
MKTSTLISELSTKLDGIEMLQKKPFIEWTEEDKYVYGTPQQITKNLNLGSFTDNQFDEWLQMIQSMTDLDQ